MVFTGDGSLTMQLGDFLTCVQHDLPVKIIVIKNDTLGLIKWEQMVFLGNPEYGVNMAPMDFVKFAEACGARGIRIDDPARCRDQLTEALSWDGPAIIECVVDEHEPPYPAKVKKDQVTKLAAAPRTAGASPCRWSGTCSTNPPSTPARPMPFPDPSAGPPPRWPAGFRGPTVQTHEEPHRCRADGQEDIISAEPVRE